MGSLRLFLALSVVAWHTSSTVLSFHGLDGNTAVQYFYIISGFYMAMVLNGKYKDLSPATFYLSRILRLYPTYLIGSILILAISYKEIWQLLISLSEVQKLIFVITNIFILGLDINLKPIDPPAWSLACELAFYFVAPYILRSKPKTILLFLFGCLYMFLVGKISFPTDSSLAFFPSASSDAFIYLMYPASIFYFSLGAFSFFVSKEGKSLDYFFAVPMVVCLILFGLKAQLIFAATIPVIFHFTKNIKFDRFIGELSYPIYILHWAFWLILKLFFEANPNYFSVISFGTYVALASALFGTIIYFLVEKKINDFRKSRLFIGASLPAINTFIAQCKWLILSAYFIFPLALLGYIFYYQIKPS